MLSDVRRFIKDGESIYREPPVYDPRAGLDYERYIVSGPGLNKGERFILSIRKAKEARVLIADSPLKIETLQGVGTIAMMNLVNGESAVRTLLPGIPVNVTTLTAFTYAIHGHGYGEWFVQETCIGSDRTHEPTPTDLAAAVGPFIGGR